MSIASSSGSSGVPERLQFQLGTQRVPSSSLNMPVWGMLNRLAQWWKGTALEGLFDRRSPWEAVGNIRGLVYSVPSFLRVHFKPLNHVLGREILSIHVDTRSPPLSKREGSH